MNQTNSTSIKNKKTVNIKKKQNNSTNNMSTVSTPTPEKEESGIPYITYDEFMSMVEKYPDNFAKALDFTNLIEAGNKVTLEEIRAYGEIRKNEQK